MSWILVVLIAFDFTLVGLLPRFFFRSDGKFNLNWWLVASPFFVIPGLLVVGALGILPLEPLFLPGLALEVVATLLSASSIALIGLTVGTNRVPLALWHQDNDAPRNIVTFGAYKMIRHPFYTSFLLAALAAFLALPHWSLLACFLYMCVALNTTAAREEKRLGSSQFGAEYQAYITRTGRFIPKLF